MTSLKGAKNPAFKHGYAMRGKKYPNIYRRWQHMIQRCHNPNDKDYSKYGAKGITVCDRWRNSFNNFLDDMGGFTNGLTIDRIDNTKGYEPSNCRWATIKQQSNNRCNTIRLTIRGVTRPLTEWAELVGIGPKTIIYRLKKMNMSHEDAVFKPKAWTKKLTEKDKQNGIE